jgi:hypothetical protein
MHFRPRPTTGLTPFPAQMGNLKLKLPHPIQSRLEFLIVANHAYSSYRSRLTKSS